MPDTCTVGELLEAVVASRFLQFSATHTTMRCRIGRAEIATVYSPWASHPRETLFRIAPETPVRSLAASGSVEVVEFDFIEA